MKIMVNQQAWGDINYYNHGISWYIYINIITYNSYLCIPNIMLGWVWLLKRYSAAPFVTQLD